jgi:magnesium transporter
MRHLFEKRHATPGTAPGTLRAPAERRVEEVAVRVLHYGPDLCDETGLATPADLEPWLDRLAAAEPGDSVTWIDIVGLHDLDLLTRLGRAFGLHSLALEDVLNVGQRPKVEEFADHLFCALRCFHRHGGELGSEQITLFLLPGVVLTFQEIHGDAFEPVRERIRRGTGRVRRAGADYLAYALIDAIVDQFFPLLEGLGERIEVLEHELVDEPGPKTLEAIYHLRRELVGLRRAAWPEREVVSTLQRQETALVQDETRVFLRDAYDHVVQVLEILETYRELAGSMLDVYLSSISHRMNEVMKVLTIIATIFIPLTFVAGIYGMNFEHMPELGWRWGYPAVLGAMTAIGLALLWYFRRRGWL